MIREEGPEQQEKESISCISIHLDRMSTAYAGDTIQSIKPGSELTYMHDLPREILLKQPLPCKESEAADVCSASNTGQGKSHQIAEQHRTSHVVASNASAHDNGTEYQQNVLYQ